MSLTRFSGSVRSAAYCATLLAITVSILIIIGKNTDSTTVSAQGPVFEADFPGTGTGAIPDGPEPCGTAGTPRNVTFTVTGITGTPTNVSVSLTGTHTWTGDLDVRLIAPGGTPSHFLFTATGDGNESSNMSGTYVFNDAASGNWWVAGTGGDSTFNIPAGSYRTSDSSGALTLMNPAFAGVANPNGTWTLEFIDFCPADTGSVSAATLTIVGAAGPTPTPTPTPVDAMADFDGDGRTDYAVLRAAPGATSPVDWWVQRSLGGFTVNQWGNASDLYVPADYDGDLKDDIAVWRPGVLAYFFILNSQNNTLRVEQWGTTGDDPTVVGDYNNDFVDDIAIYRPGNTANALSFWWWRSGNTIQTIQWGVGSDYPAPGDYNGDNKMDYGIQRPAGANSVFWILDSDAITYQEVMFGGGTDYVVPGDYDGDRKTDMAVVAVQGGQLVWTYRPSAGGTDVTVNWGNAMTDIPAPGDYNGDGRADFTIWRIGSLAFFWSLSGNLSNHTIIQWGTTDDVPVTFSYVH